VLVITGETSTYIFGKGGLQESSGEGGAIDQGSLFSGITRYHKLIERTDYLGQVLNQATRALFSRDPGPVLLSIPFNVQKEMVAGGRAGPGPHPASWRTGSARNPASGGTGAAAPGSRRSGHRRRLWRHQGRRARVVARLSQTFGYRWRPVSRPRGVVSEGSPLSLGCLGVTSNGDAYRYIVEHADLVVFLGAGFNERTSYLWDSKLLAGKKVAQVDRDAAQLNKVFKADVSGPRRYSRGAGGIAGTAEADAASGVASVRLAKLAGHRQAAPADDRRGKFRLMEAFFAGLCPRASPKTR